MQNLDRTRGTPRLPVPVSPWHCEALGHRLIIEPTEDRIPMTYLALSAIYMDLWEMYVDLPEEAGTEERHIQNGVFFVWALPMDRTQQPTQRLFRGKLQYNDGATGSQSSRSATGVVQTA